jgi:hypothetical protein
MVVQPVFRHSIFRPAVKATDNHVIKRCVTSSAGRVLLKPFFGNAIFRPAVKATNYNKVIRFHEKTLIIISSDLKRIGEFLRPIPETGSVHDLVTKRVYYDFCLSYTSCRKK